MIDTTIPDAELIALCAQFETAQKQIAALYEGPDDTDEDVAAEVLAAIYEEHIDPILHRLDAIQAQTPAGIHARARAVATSNPAFESTFDAEGTVPYRLLAGLMRDAAALEVKAS